MYRNPVPVAVAMVPVDGGLLGIRRANAPALGEKAMPGGFVEFGETFCMAASRELREETGVNIPADEFLVFSEGISSDGTKLLVFCLSAIHLDQLPDDFKANAEVSEVMVLHADDKLGFPLHQTALEHYFDVMIDREDKLRELSA